ncbi:MAG: Ig-like domain-containing protein, partial [Bacteroidota bacterium]|nr:Ig-like domain-containing protein [Bacteroidota bacterium]
TTVIPQNQEITNLPVDKAVFASFNLRVDRASVPGNFILKEESGEQVAVSFNYLNDDKTISAVPENNLLHNHFYTIEIGTLRAVTGEEFPGATYTFRTEIGNFTLNTITINGVNLKGTDRIQDVEEEWVIEANFNEPLNPSTIFEDYIKLIGKSGSVPLTFDLSEDQETLIITSTGTLNHLSRYAFTISPDLKSEEDLGFSGFDRIFYSAVDATPKFPEISDDALLTLVQEQTFRYFWDFGHPESGMARERNSSGDLVTVGGSGFGVMAIIAGIERGFISRQQGVERLGKIVNFLKTGDRFHGVWPHWMDGRTGKVIPFSTQDNGGDLVETAFMIQGLLTVRQYLEASDPQELVIIDDITQLWEEVEWDWYTKGGENVLYWHWSPQHEWAMNHQIKGWNESLIVYVLAASSPTHSISANVYHEGWASNGAMRNGRDFYNINLPLGEDYGGPLFFSHYSFLGLDPRNLEDQYANYWEQNVNHSLINHQHAVVNPQNFVGYGAESWGFTASDNHTGYSAHSPTNDRGVITPTAALSSIPYTPEESMAAIRHFYYILGDKLWGNYGFYDALNPTEDWVANSYLAIDQGPIIIMIENYRTALLWDLFMNDPEIREGLSELGFTY